MKRISFAVLVTLFITALPAFSWPTIYPTGTTVYLPDQAYNGYTLFTPIDAKPDVASTMYLINMRGEVVHRWQLPFVALSGRLLPDGNLIAIGINPKTPPNRPGFGKFWIGGAAGSIIEVSWDGKPVFRHNDLAMHHDMVKLANGHYLYLAWEQVPRALQARVRGGTKGSEFAGGIMFNDMLVEVDAQGKTVWTWHANAHLDPDIDIIGPLYDRGEWCHMDSVSVLANGNILLTSRQTDSMMIVERKTGRIAWRWGNNTYLDRRTGRLEQRFDPKALGGPHNAMEIPRGYPGAGHLICFDNGLYNSMSRAVEVDPATRNMVWHSGQAQWGRTSFSWFLGSAQRLPNGNTLICEGANGRFIQVTASREVVWEYVNPYISSPKLMGAVFKALQYAPDYCARFKTLRPAKGAAVGTPTTRIIQSEEHPDILPRPLAVGVITALAAVLVVLISKRKRKAT